METARKCDLKMLRLLLIQRISLRNLRKAIEASGARRGFSNSRTCEIGLTTHSGIPYQSLIYLIDEATR